MILPIGPDKRMTRQELLDDEVRLMFMQLLLHPERDMLSENPCARCGRYYLKKTVRKARKYCSRTCGSRATAISSRKKGLQERRDKKLQIVKEEAQRWLAVRTRYDWKHWISQTSVGNGIQNYSNIHNQSR